MRNRIALFATTVAASLALVGSAGIAAAAPAPSATQQEIDGVLAAHPDSRQTAGNRVTFGDGTSLTLSTSAVQDIACPSDSMCLYVDQYYKGNMYEIPAFLCGQGIIFNMKDNGFNDVTSSWINATRGLSNKIGTTYWDYDALGGKLFQMLPITPAPTLPAEYNDEASSALC